jgi:hypothetical protein
MPRAAAERSGTDEFLAHMEEVANERALGKVPLIGGGRNRPGGGPPS